MSPSVFSPVVLRLWLNMPSDARAPVGHGRGPGGREALARGCSHPGLGPAGSEQSALLSEQMITFIVSSQFGSVNLSCTAVARRAWCYRI